MSLLQFCHYYCNFATINCTQIIFESVPVYNILKYAPQYDNEDNCGPICVRFVSSKKQLKTILPCRHEHFTLTVR